MKKSELQKHTKNPIVCCSFHIKNVKNRVFPGVFPEIFRSISMVSNWGFLVMNRWTSGMVSPRLAWLEKDAGMGSPFLQEFTYIIFIISLRLLGMSWGVKTTCLEAPGVSLGGSGVSIGGVGSLRDIYIYIYHILI